MFRLFRRRRPGPKGVNPEGWMMSYADMVTVLLSLFIVLTTLGKDQTGVRLQKGMEGYRRSRELFGLPGALPNSAQPWQLDHATPRYLLEDPNDDAAARAGKSADGEAEQLRRFLGEMKRQFRVEEMPRVLSQAAVDFYDPLGKSPLLAGRNAEVAGQVLAVLSRRPYRVHVVVWATMPSPSAWERAARLSRRLAEEIAGRAELDADARERLVPLGQPWRYPNHQRPVFSLVVSRCQLSR
jgi:hypothetical protein